LSLLENPAISPIVFGRFSVCRTCRTDLF